MAHDLFPDLHDETPAGAESSDEPSSARPLADRMRPRSLDEVIGQEHLLGSDKFLRQAVRADQIPSMILWGPPGVGKTTLAQIIARETDAHFVAMSAVLSGVKDVKRVIEEARFRRRTSHRPTILFVDEIHRFNKAQQDAFLAHVENGTLVLIGATTENPSFEVIAPLLSRTRVLVLRALTDEQIFEILERALRDEDRGLGLDGIAAAPEALRKLAQFANGDARSALNALEVAAQLAKQLDAEAPEISISILESALQHRSLLYDKTGEEHYNLVSALHKALRNSDVDASLYWLARMLESGEDPLYIARRLVRFASEDIGMADPKALGYALHAKDAFHFIGLPEGKLALAQIVAYLALSPKSNAVYLAYQEAASDVAATRNDPVPLHLRNAPTGLMKDLGYSKGYRYAHDEDDGVSLMECLPEALRDRRYYRPTQRGLEKSWAERLKWIAELRRKSSR